MVGDPFVGQSAVVLGYPLDGPFKASPASVGRTIVSLTQDSYGNGPIRRTVTVLRGTVRPGNSGGPLVNSAGEVVGTVFGRTIEKGASVRVTKLDVGRLVVIPQKAKSAADLPISNESSLDRPSDELGLDWLS
jgi:S1-C subfamily serine protease